MEYASFYVGSDLFCIPIYLVQEIKRESEISCVPGHDKRIEGLMSLRGATAVVINLHNCLFVNTISCTDPSLTKRKLIVLETNDNIPESARELGISGYEEPVVLLVDNVYKIVFANKKEYHATPAHVKDEFVDGVIKAEDDLITILSVPKLIENLISEQEAVHGNH